MLLKRLQNNGSALLRLNTIQKQAKKEVENKIQTGKYTFEEICCPICNSTETERIGEKDRYGFFYPSDICKKCGLIYISKRMTERSFSEFYNCEYRRLYVGKDIPSNTFFIGQQKKGELIYKYLENNNLIYNSDKLSVLEVGCGAGGILHYFKQKGHKIKGIDLGEEYINYGKKTFDLDLEVSSLEKLKLLEKPDLIIYSHVFEHILDLNKELTLIKQFSHKNTIVYIEVPGIKEIHKNYKSDILLYFQNAHTFNFSLETLKNIFGKNGFELICGNQFVRSAFKSNINTSNCKPIKSDYLLVKDYIISTDKKRFLYPFTLRSIKRRINQILYFILQKLHLKP